MRIFSTSIIAAYCLVCLSLLAQDQASEDAAAPRGDTWTKEVQDRTKRGTLRDAYQKVRGDSGKWNDDPKLQHAPPLSLKPANMSLDDWYDRLERTRRRPLTPADDNWLLFKTKQLDDNDRVWVERVERGRNQFTVTLNQAIWKGRYQKTFTYYNVFGVNLGKLAPGSYEVKWIIKPLVFRQFEGNGRPLDEERRDNWSKDERPADKKPVELSTTFKVAVAN
jgi:hypothetical protein